MINERFNSWFEKTDRSNYINEVFRTEYPSLSLWKSIDSIKGKGSHYKKKNYKPLPNELEEIKNILYKNYYSKVRADYYNNVNLAYVIADASLIYGVEKTIKTLQRLMHITVDGIAGRQTVTTANNFNGLLTAFAKTINMFNIKKVK